MCVPWPTPLPPQTSRATWSVTRSSRPGTDGTDPLSCAVTGQGTMCLGRWQLESTHLVTATSVASCHRNHNANMGDAVQQPVIMSPSVLQMRPVKRNDSSDRWVGISGTTSFKRATTLLL